MPENQPKSVGKMLEKHFDLDQILENSRLFQNQPCIYYLINASDEVIYVGQTKNLYAQLLHHKLAGKNFVRFSFFPSGENEESETLENEVIVQSKPALSKPIVTHSTSSYLTKQLICLKHNMTPPAFESLRESFGLESVHSFGNTKYYKPGDVEAWLKRFKGLVVRGRHVLQVSPDYLAVGISARTKQIQLYRSRLSI